MQTHNLGYPRIGSRYKFKSFVAFFASILGLEILGCYNPKYPNRINFGLSLLQHSSLFKGLRNCFMRTISQFIGLQKMLFNVLLKLSIWLCPFLC
ncbi:hypothetical protein EV194_11425 [Natronoflexus pectinivorans]|uniref:Uncharacterized protein n=1 Tax=Natronoflexus pectinivorans TaxID=682526 RepID=A0A4R2GD91_9BACT|nr:hypothetical protein EV194_11425 [Natronoflexus pectinivorans]